jgi:hypothetical protein
VYAVGRATGKTTPLTRLGSYAAVFNGTAHFLSPAYNSQRVGD